MEVERQVSCYRPYALLMFTVRMMSSVDSLVLGTVNASFKRSLDADTLAETVRRSDIDMWLPHIATFFAEVRAHLVIAFAKAHEIPLEALAGTYAKVKALTGEFNRDLDAELSGLGVAA